MRTMMWAKVNVVVAVVVAVVGAGMGGGFWTKPLAVAGEPAEIAAAEGAQAILDATGCWRFFGARGPGVIPLDLLKAAEPAATASKTVGGDDETPSPPADWSKPDFDDSSWLRAAGPFPGGHQGHAGIWGLNWRRLICVRGRFAVADPAAVKKIALTMKYAGGVVVYLNGKEVFRQDMPAGDVKLDTPADPYPLDAYVDSKGKIIPFQAGADGRIKAGETDLVDRMAKRAAREVKPIALPVQGLRKGVNVLAVEVHAAAHRPEALQFYKGDYPACWPHIGLNALRLAADAAPGAIEPNLSRPKGFRVWNQDMHRQFNDADYADPNEPVGPITLVGAANGFYSGLVVAGSDAPLDGLKAVVTDLKGAGTIPAANIRVRYAQISHLGQGYGNPSIFIGLEKEPPARVEPGPGKGVVQPVWVTVQVPKGAAAGKYQGTLELSAAGVAAVKVPVEIDVVGWTLPDPTAFRSFMSIYESPDSVALQYDVPVWSEEHWKRLEKSAELLGHLGNNFACVPLVCRTEFGNDESMVTWIRKADGSYDYDFSAFDRYLDLLMKYCTIKIVACQVYFGGGWGVADPTKRAVSVTVVDPAAKKREMVEMPLYGTEESRKQWKPLVDQLQERLKKKGLSGTLVFGVGHCGGIHKDVVAFFKEIAPGAGWHIAKHNRARPNEFPTHRYVEWMYILYPLPVPSPLPKFPNDGKGLISIMMERISDPGQPAISMRTMAERAYLLGDSGAGRTCLDYWPVKGSVGGNYSTDGSLFSRWPGASAAQRGPQVHYLSFPGKSGAVSTPKIEALREGLQETEARRFIEDALAANTVGGDLAERCRKLVASRAALCKMTHSTGDQFTAIPLWPARAEAAYRLAAEVAGKGL
ncbi:MAG: glycoside hydrolase domain-containing protein [Planctomycetota bacterium]